MTTTMQSRLAMAGLAALLGVLLGGCTSDDSSLSDAVESPGGVQAASALDQAAFDAIVACVEERGWDIVVDDNADGTLGFGAPGVSEDQNSAFVADVEDCTALNAHPKPLDDFTDEEWAVAYEKIVGSAECLRAQGYDIPETPSFQAWKESFYIGDGSRQWVPWGFVPVPSMSGDETRELEAICPQVGLGLP